MYTKIIETNTIVAIGISSTALSVIAGHKKLDGTLCVEACATCDATPFVKRGVPQNIDEMATALTALIASVEQKLNATISYAYVGVGGLSLHGVRNSVKVAFQKEEKITDAHLDQLSDSNHNTAYDGYQIVDAFEQIYNVGRTETLQPIGMMAAEIEARYLNLVQQSRYLKVLDMVLEQVGIVNYEYIVAPVSTAYTVLSEEEMRGGCALIDMGAALTTVSVFCGGVLRHLETIPMGSNAVNRDLTTLAGISLQDAETIKRQLPNHAPQEPLPQQLYEIAAARVEEILVNAMDQIDLSGYRLKLSGGIVFTGGGAYIACLPTLIAAIYPNEKVRFAYAPRYEGNLSQVPSYQVTPLLALVTCEGCSCLKPIAAVQPTADDAYETPVEAMDKPTEKPANKSTVEVVIVEKPIEIVTPEVSAADKTQVEDKSEGRLASTTSQTKQPEQQQQSIPERKPTKRSRVWASTNVFNRSLDFFGEALGLGNADKNNDNTQKP